MRARRPPRRDRPSVPVELTFLPGLDEVVAREVAREVHGASNRRAVPGRDDAFLYDVAGSLAPLLNLRTVVAPFRLLTFDVPRPKSLVSDEHFPQIVEAIDVMRALNRADPPTTFRFDAAGADSPVFRRLAARLTESTGLQADPESGDCMLRFRRSAEANGWDVLVRLSKRPLSARPWRVHDHPAAANATIAAAMTLLTRPRPGDAVINLACGSGTLLIERLLHSPARFAVALDIDPKAIAGAIENLTAAGVRSRATLLTSDLRADEWLDYGPFDVLLADPPWGDKAGRHADNEALHLALLEQAHAAAAPGARLAVLTHEIRIMERCLRHVGELWEPQSETRIFAKGHHPRIYLLHKRSGSAGGAALTRRG